MTTEVDTLTYAFRGLSDEEDDPESVDLDDEELEDEDDDLADDDEEETGGTEE